MAQADKDRVELDRLLKEDAELNDQELVCLQHELEDAQIHLEDYFGENDLLKENVWKLEG